MFSCIPSTYNYLQNSAGTASSATWLSYWGNTFFSPKCPGLFSQPPTFLFSGNQVSFPELKRLELEAMHTHTSTADVKNKWRNIFTPPICFYGVGRDNVTFTFNNSVTVHSAQTKRRFSRRNYEWHAELHVIQITIRHKWRQKVTWPSAVAELHEFRKELCFEVTTP